LFFCVDKLENENSNNCHKLGVTTGVSVIFGTIVSNISNTLAGPIWSGGRVERLADSEEVGVEEYEDDSEKSCQFRAI
jgi:hypothetical protein